MFDFLGKHNSKIAMRTHAFYVYVVIISVIIDVAPFYWHVAVDCTINKCKKVVFSFVRQFMIGVEFVCTNLG